MSEQVKEEWKVESGWVGGGGDVTINDDDVVVVLVCVRARGE